MFCMQERNQHEWVNGHRIYIFGRTISIFDHYTVMLTSCSSYWSLFCKRLFLLFINILFLAHNRWQNTTWSVAWKQDFGRIYHEPPKKKVQKRTSGEWWRPSSGNYQYLMKRSVGKQLWVAGQEEQGLCSETFVLYPCLDVCCTLYLFKRERILKEIGNWILRHLYFCAHFVKFLLLTFSSVFTFWEKFRKAGLCRSAKENLSLNRAFFSCSFCCSPP